MEVFQLSPNFTLDQLKESYRRVIVLVHPDKGGTEELFQYVTDCFRALFEELKKREDKTFQELKAASHQAEKERETNFAPRAELMGDGFQNRFNEMYDNNRLEDEEKDAGYGGIMEKSTKIREDITLPKVFQDKKFNEKKFNDAFESKVSVSKEVVYYEEPEALVHAKKLNFVEIGKKAGDFSDSGTNAKRVQYMDYMKAHTTERLIDERHVQKRKEFKNVDDYESFRETYSQRELTSEERDKVALRKIQEENDEIKRLEKLKERDNMIHNHYQKVQNLMLAPSSTR